METSSIEPDAAGYIVHHPVQKQFMKNPKFCLSLQEHLQNSLSTQIAIIPPELPEDWSSMEDLSGDYIIKLIKKHKNRARMEKNLSDSLTNLFEAIQSKTFTDDNVKAWFQHLPTKVNNLECLQKIMNEKMRHTFTMCEIRYKQPLKIYYLPKIFGSVPNSEELDKLIHEKISQETILLPFQYERSQPINRELEKLTTNEEIYVACIFNRTNSKTMQDKIILFGYYKTVNRLKRDLLNIIEKYQLITFKLDSFYAFQIEFLLKTSAEKIYEIEEKYEEFGVKIQLKTNEFSAPLYLKNEIESSIREMLSHSPTTIFKSIKFSKDVAEIAEKHLKYIAHKNHCYIGTELKCKYQPYTIPKALPSNIYVSKSVIKQSDHFLSSLDVFSRIIVANGSIEIRTGDIALQKVDIIVISTTSNGLKEGVIERASAFEYEHTYTDASGITFTETDGGQLCCKRILFSNWMPSTITMDKNDLRKSVESFVSKSIEYATKDQNPKSIAFAVPDSCTNEEILAQEMIAAAKQQLESKNLQLKISFILLPEQQTLHRQFFTLIEAVQDIYAYFNWPISVIKITLMASDAKYLTNCQEKINIYLKRCTPSTKLADPHSIFQYWDQYTINTFYKYCKDKFVLPQIDPTNKELELTGPVNNILEVKQKWQFLFDLAKENASRIPQIERPSSVVLRSTRRETGTSIEQTKVYNIIIGYCQQDKIKCQYLINRFIEEGFSIWAEPVIVNQQRNVFSQIDKSDCILLCISEDYYESETCEKEAQYALQTGKQVFLVKIRNDPLIGWQRRLFENKFFFQLFGSENHFDLEFGKLLLEILKYTKPGFVPLLQQKSGRAQLDHDESRRLSTVEQQRSIYDKKIRRLTKIGRIDQEEMKNLIREVQNVINDIDGNESESNQQSKEVNNDHQNATKESNWLERWLKKPTNITKQNLPPFVVSGDINDAVFPMPEYVLKTLNLHSTSFTPAECSSNKFGNTFEDNIIRRSIQLPFKRPLYNRDPIDFNRTCGICTRKLEVFDGLSQVFGNRSRTTDINPQEAMNLPVLSSEILSVNEKDMEELRNRCYTDEMKGRQNEVAENSIKKCKHLTRDELDAYLKKFAQQMNENAIQFEKFCSMAAVASQKKLDLKTTEPNV